MTMRARHTLLVQLRRKAAGNAPHTEYVDNGPAVPVRGTVYPLDAAEVQYYGDRAIETRKFFCRSWPGDIFCRITYDGAQWDQVEPATVHGIGQGTRHVEVVIRRRTRGGGQ